MLNYYRLNLDITFTHDEDSYLAFALTPGVGPIKFNNLIKSFGSVTKAYTANANELLPILGPATTNEYITFRHTYHPEIIISQYAQRQITLIPRSHPQFPKLLLEIADPPICLFALHQDCKPILNDDCLYFSIVGSRKYTAYGKATTFQIASDLAIAGVTIVSGLAIGIDAFAHEATISNKGTTIAVLGCGVEVSYPPQNHALRQRIIDSGNCIISEYPPNMQPTRGSFVSRNRIISGMSRGVLIVEGSDKSGSLITATCAANQGRDVFAVPGQISAESSQAPLILLKQGAKLTTSSSDILTEYQIQKLTTKKPISYDNFNPQETQVLNCLINGSLYIDEIALTLKWTVAQVMSVLTILEIGGSVEKDQNGKYALV